MDYGAITLDTSIFDQKNIALESGLLKTLEQFKGKHCSLILSEIVLKEVHIHLRKKVSETREKMNKALRDSTLHLNLDKNNIEKAKELLLPKPDDEAIAKQRLEDFLKNTGAEKIPATNYVNLEPLLKKYFDSQPPFSQSRKKKNEFPDAIALMSLEKWAEKNNTKILAVSNDNDWELFANESNYIDINKDLAEAIAIFQPHDTAIDYCNKLASDILEGKMDNIYSEIEARLTDNVSSIDSYPIAFSEYIWEADDVEIEFGDFEFIEDAKNKASMQPIQSQDNSVTIEAKIEVYATACCAFTFLIRDSVDKDYLKIGESSVPKDFNFEAEILFTVEGDFLNQPENVEITDFELLSYPSNIDFGEIEPDWSDEDIYVI